MKNAVVYIHGKGGSADEALYYKKFFNDAYDVLRFDYKSELPWQAGEEFQNYFDSLIPNYNEILLIANSIGAYFSMLSLSEKPIKKALFVSPIVDMKNIILHMMKRAKISEEELRLKKSSTFSSANPYRGNIFSACYASTSSQIECCIKLATFQSTS